MPLRLQVKPMLKCELPLLLGRLKEKDPEIYRRMMELANDKLKEKTDEG